jgi:hypothetical protein
MRLYATVAEQLGAGLPNQLRGCDSRLSLCASSTCSSSELGALQTRHGSVRLRSTSPGLSLVDSVAPSKRKRAGSMPAESAHAAFDYWLGREVLNLEERDRYSHAVPRLCRRIGRSATNGAQVVRFHPETPCPRQRTLDAALRTLRLLFDSARGRHASFWDRLTAGRELLDLAIVVRLHGPEPCRASTAGEVRGLTNHVRRVRSPGSVRIGTATWVRGRA